MFLLDTAGVTGNIIAGGGWRRQRRAWCWVARRLTRRTAAGFLRVQRHPFQLLNFLLLAFIADSFNTDGAPGWIFSSSWYPPLLPHSLCVHRRCLGMGASCGDGRRHRLLDGKLSCHSTAPPGAAASSTGPVKASQGLS